MHCDKKKSFFENATDLVPPIPKAGMSITDIIQLMGDTCFEARNVSAAAGLMERMINDGDTIWLGIAGAGIAGGMGGQVIALIKSGFVDAICSTGAQVYHDLHFAFDLPVKQITPHVDDDLLRKCGDTRIYDIGIRDQETLCVQDKLVRDFISERYDVLSKGPLASWQFMYELGLWAADKAVHPERSLVIAAAKQGVPIFWDSLANHSIGMNLLGADMDGQNVAISLQQDILDSAAVVYAASQNGFIELGGGGPKNFIQQTGPVLQHILGMEFEGADRGIQIGTAVERDGSLSGCTFGEAVTWGKYCSADERKLVQVWAEYSMVFPLLVAYVIDQCKTRPASNLVARLPDLSSDLRNKYADAINDVS